MRFIIILLIVFGLWSCDRRDSITRFSEDNHMEKSYYVYPSTLRMVNLEQNEDYNEFIKDLVKGRYFSISKNEGNALLIDDLKKDLSEEGFEEAMIFKSKGNDAVVYVLDRKVPKIAAILELPEHFNIIEVEGMINVAKIPALLENFNDEEFLNVIDITEKDRNKHRVERRSEDK